MNAESLKTELQQVLNNDLVLRKEFSELKRSLSDYRNQLIIRDEDCLRLQVTIDVLNTKLGVLERENGNYKMALETLEKSNSLLSEELAAGKADIETRLGEIEALKSELGTVISSYEEKLDVLRTDTSLQVNSLREQYDSEVSLLRSEVRTGEESVRQQYDKLMQDMQITWAEKEHQLACRYNDTLSVFEKEHAEEVFHLKEQFNNTLSGLSAASHEEQAELKVKYETAILALEQKLKEKVQVSTAEFNFEAGDLDAANEIRERLSAEFNANLEAMAAEYAAREERLRNGYESKIAGLNTALAESAEELAFSLEHRILAVKNSQAELLRENVSDYECRMAGLINSYEEKIANLLIHTNASNSKLSSELREHTEALEKSGAEIQQLNQQLEEKETIVSGLTASADELLMQLHNERERANSLEAALSARPASAAADEEETNRLTAQIAHLNHSHSDYVAELSLTIDGLSAEVGNMAEVVAAVSNELGKAEAELEQKQLELDAERHDLLQAKQKITTLEAALAEKEMPAEYAQSTETAVYEEKLNTAELEYRKLLAENEQVIHEIEEVQRDNEIRQTEVTLLRTELDELRTQSEGRAGELKETLNSKNFEITALEADNAALSKELELLKAELTDLTATLADKLSHSTTAAAEDTVFQEDLSENSETDSLENQNYINELLRYIDELNTQQISLLDEKEKMAEQLLKMNEVVGYMSQHVDAEEIDVTGLNNHRKSTILAGNSAGAAEKAPMKKKINELVREIDKCIALLSA